MGLYHWTGQDGKERQEIDFWVEVNDDLANLALEWEKHLEYAWITAAELPTLMAYRPLDEINITLQAIAQTFYLARKT